MVGGGFFATGFASRQLASTNKMVSPKLRMAPSIATAACVLALAGCTDGGSGFTGDYETVAITTGACDVAGTPDAIPDSDRWFQLADVDTSTGLLVGYFPCVAPGECLADHDLYRSFGRDGDRWLTTIAIALDPGCTLRFRERTLQRTGDATIQIDDVAYEELDPTLAGDSCTISEAKRRGTAMPCVSRTEIFAESRAF